MLLDAAKKLIRVEFLLAGSGASQKAHVQYDYVAAAGFYTVQHISQVIHVEVIADGHKNVARLCSYGFRCEFAFQFQVELIHLHVCDAAMTATPLGNRKDDIQKKGKGPARPRGHGLRK